MKLNRLKILIVLLFIIIADRSIYAGDLSFDRALKILMESNESLLAAQQEMSQKNQEMLATRGLYYPKIEMGGRYTHIKEPLTIDLDPIRQAILSVHPEIPPDLVPLFQTTVQDDSFANASLNLTWPIFTGGKILAANANAKAQLKESQETARWTENKLISHLTELYFGLCLAQYVENVRFQVLEGLNQHVYQARRLKEEGLISRAECLHAEVSQAEADRELKKSRHDVTISRIALSNILAGTKINYADSPLFLIPDIPPLDHFIREAVSKHPALGRLSTSREMAHQSVRAENARWFPKIYVFGKRELYTPDLTLLDPEYAYGIGAKLTVFEGFSRKHRTKAAKHLEKRIELIEQKTRRDIITLVEKEYTELLKSLEQNEVLAKSLLLAEENVRTRTHAFEEGFATSLDVVDAQLALAKVRLEHLLSVYNFDVALARLLESSGQSELFQEFQQKADVEIRL